jgi:uncharacterized membrane protein YkvA (DUF1232 family)
VRTLAGLAIALLAAWLALAIALLLARPRGARLADALRLLPDVLRLLARLARDPALPRAVRVRLWLLLAYLASPIDLIPDLVPVLGHLDDAIVAVIALRAVVRRAGPEAIRRHWPGSPDGLAALARAAGLELAPHGEEG